MTGAGSAFPNDVGRDGSYLARDLKFDLRTWAFPLPRDTAEETRTIDRSLGFATDVVLSGDSSMFASIENAPGVGTARLFVQSTNGGVRRLVAEVAGNVSAPRWSPDGSRLAIRVAPTSGAAHWATLDVRDGSLTSMAPVPGVKGVRGGAITLGFPPAWSGDGKFLFAPDVVRIGEPRLRRYSLAAGDTGVVISRFWESREGYAPEGIVTSPDGRHLVVGGASLVVVPVGGGREREILKPDSVTNVIPIRWDSDGQVIYAGRDARRAGDEMHELWSVRATGGPPTSLGALPAPCTIHIMLVRDGRLATCYSTQTVMDIVRRRGLTR